MTPPRKISISRAFLAERGSFLYIYIYKYRARSRKEKESGLYRRARAVRTADVAVNTYTWPVHTGIEDRLSFPGKDLCFCRATRQDKFPFPFHRAV